MNIVIKRSRFTTNLITAGLLTMFVSAFGVFANIQIEQRNANCINALGSALDGKACSQEKLYTAALPMEQTVACHCPAATALATNTQAH